MVGDHPGNRYFRLEGKSYYFNRNMPLEAEGLEGQLHRETCHLGLRCAQMIRGWKTLIVTILRGRVERASQYHLLAH